jgi:hypothetical protein
MKDKPKDQPSGKHPFDRLFAKRGISLAGRRPIAWSNASTPRIGEAIALQPKRGSAKQTFKSHADRDAFLCRLVADYNGLGAMPRLQIPPLKFSSIFRDTTLQRDIASRLALWRVANNRWGDLP